ncbi:WG repeat-containing protein [Fodinicurvata sediminis]|uniref:WG repeat-containing protein n=1 Tax=Fodinicurvata sediminis TaxID=1121832 RepID=UPI0003B3471C|nr:WG repeat-containing protein [Fodinicurvata sediminis]
MPMTLPALLSRPRGQVLSGAILLTGLFLVTPAIAQGCGPSMDQAQAEEEAGLYPLFQEDHWGYVDREGQWQIAPQWRQARPFSQGRAAVETADGWGIIDRTGSYVVAPGARDADSVHIDGADYHLSPYKPYSEGCSAATPQDGKPHYLDLEGERWDPPGLEGHQVADLGPFSEGLAWVRVIPDDDAGDSRVGWINDQGEMVIPPEFAHGADFSNDRAPAALSDENWGYIDREGSIVFPGKFTLSAAAPYSDGLAAVTLGQDKGYMHDKDWALRELTEPDGTTRAFDEVASFHEGRAAVKPERAPQRVVWIDSEGQVAVDPERQGRLSICDPERLPRYRHGLLPLVVARGGNVCGQPLDLSWNDKQDPRGLSATPPGVQRFPKAKLVYLDRAGKVVIDSTDCRPEPGAAPLSATTEDGELAPAAYRLDLEGQATGSIAPQRADSPCNLSRYTASGLNADGPWQLRLNGMATWKDQSVQASLSFNLPPGLEEGTHAFQGGFADDALRANLWFSLVDAGPSAQRPDSYHSVEGGTLELTQFDRAAMSGRFAMTLAASETPEDRIELSGSFREIPYSYAPEVVVSEATGSFAEMAEAMERPAAQILSPGKAEIAEGELRVQLGKWGPQLLLRFPEDQPDGPFQAGPEQPVKASFADKSILAKGELERRDGMLFGSFEVDITEQSQIEGTGLIRGRFDYLPLEQAE